MEKGHNGMSVQREMPHPHNIITRLGGEDPCSYLCLQQKKDVPTGPVSPGTFFKQKHTGLHPERSDHRSHRRKELHFLSSIPFYEQAKEDGLESLVLPR